MSARADVPRVTFPEMLERLHAERYTGPTIIHWAQGVPNVIEIPGAPERITLQHMPLDRIASRT